VAELGNQDDHKNRTNDDTGNFIEEEIAHGRPRLIKRKIGAVFGMRRARRQQVIAVICVVCAVMPRPNAGNGNNAITVLWPCRTCFARSAYTPAGRIGPRRPTRIPCREFKTRKFIPMIRMIALAGLSVLALSAGSQAQDQEFTLGAGYERIEIGELEFDTISLRGGLTFTEHFGIEAQANFGIDEETIDVLGASADVDFNYLLGVFGVARLPVNNDQTVLFARAGYTTSEAEASLGGFSVAADDDAWAYGVGVEHTISGPHGVRFDYTRYDYDGEDADGLALSYIYRFNAN
jgi:outer membrane immunogenic protein